MKLGMVSDQLLAVRSSRSEKRIAGLADIFPVFRTLFKKKLA